jgi:PIN domain nuclease of toxin-antitoxin system
VTLLLDTHVWIWSVEGDTARIGRRTRSLLARAEPQDAIRVAPVSVFEVMALHTQGRLRLSRAPEQWVRAALDPAGVRLAPLSADAAIDAGLVRRDAVPDPLDRLLVAIARDLDAVFVTADRVILDYASRSRLVRAHNAST